MTFAKLGLTWLICFGLANVSVWATPAAQKEQITTSRVKAAYPNWGFIVLDAGQQHGLSKGSKLEIFRDGQLLGKIVVTETEAKQAVADLVPTSLKPGVTIQKGDLVVGPALKKPGAAPPKPPVQPAVVNGIPKRALKIIATNHEFGFIILDGGKNHGVTPNTKFQLLRDGKRIALLRIATVEPQVTVAEVIPGSLAEGIAVQVNDEAWALKEE